MSTSFSPSNVPGAINVSEPGAWIPATSGIALGRNRYSHLPSGACATISLSPPSPEKDELIVRRRGAGCRRQTIEHGRLHIGVVHRCPEMPEESRQEGCGSPGAARDVHPGNRCG